MMSISVFRDDSTSIYANFIIKSFDGDVCKVVNAVMYNTNDISRNQVQQEQ